ncbi:MAG: YegS/Rv2252/BmrU family lipid kinase, partial [Oscillospiraceae bacterium]|nr:YegS/Rv2252/BmrU family lipid kinase [Candidatus Equicaccousia limihippi]
MRNFFIINPVAGKGNYQKEIEKQLDGQEVYYTRHHGDASDIARKLAEMHDQIRIFCCGGEGTVFEVLNGIVGKDNVELGIIPCGTANDFLKGFGKREDFFNVQEQLDGVAVDIDLVKAGDKYVFNSCSVGLDAIVCQNVAKFKRWPLVNDRMAYTLSLIYCFLGKTSMPLNIEVNGKKISRDCLFAVAANAPWYGGGYMPAPTASPFDGIMDYTTISAVSRLKILSLLNVYKRGEHIGRDFCESGETLEMTVSSENEMPINMDGEIFTAKNITFSLIKKGARIVLPKKIY